MRIPFWGISKDPRYLRTQYFLNKQEVEGSADVGIVRGSCSTHRLAWCVFTAAQSIYSISMALSLHNHISTDLKSHTCCNAIYLEAGFIASNLSPLGAVYICALCLFVQMCLSLCLCTCQYLSKIPYVPGLVGVI